MRTTRALPADWSEARGCMQGGGALGPRLPSPHPREVPDGDSHRESVIFPWLLCRKLEVSFLCKIA